jgi:hypothetical protein
LIRGRDILRIKEIAPFTGLVGPVTVQQVQNLSHQIEDLRA